MPKQIKTPLREFIKRFKLDKQEIADALEISVRTLQSRLNNPQELTLDQSAKLFQYFEGKTFVTETEFQQLIASTTTAVC